MKGAGITDMSNFDNEFFMFDKSNGVVWRTNFTFAMHAQALKVKTEKIKPKEAPTHMSKYLGAVNNHYLVVRYSEDEIHLYYKSQLELSNYRNRSYRGNNRYDPTNWQLRRPEAVLKFNSKVRNQNELKITFEQNFFS